jgi:drug/metabolite transporter (DMT)-like permease
MTGAAIVLAFASAVFLGAGAVLTQFGLRTVAPLSGAAISIPAFTLSFLAISPFLIRADTIVWHAVPIFAVIGLLFPVLVTLLTFASSRALGPVVTSALGNLAPLFSVALAVLLLHEPLRLMQFVGLVVAVLGVLIITIRRADAVRDWRVWTLLLPLGAALLRGVIPPVIKVGLEIWPDPVGASLTGYIFSSLTVLIIERIRNGSFIVRAPWTGRAWFACTGILNGVGTLLLYAALGAGPVTLVAPLVATYPLVTVVLSAIFLAHVRITARLVTGVIVTVAGVILILTG